MRDGHKRPTAHNQSSEGKTAPERGWVLLLTILAFSFGLSPWLHDGPLVIVCLVCALPFDTLVDCGTFCGACLVMMMGYVQPSCGGMSV